MRVRARLVRAWGRERASHTRVPGRARAGAGAASRKASRKASREASRKASRRASRRASRKPSRNSSRLASATTCGRRNAPEHVLPVELVLCAGGACSALGRGACETFALLVLFARRNA